jgi:hypothetical protein
MQCVADVRKLGVNGCALFVDAREAFMAMCPDAI